MNYVCKTRVQTQPKPTQRPGPRGTQGGQTRPKPTKHKDPNEGGRKADIRQTHGRDTRQTKHGHMADKVRSSVNRFGKTNDALWEQKWTEPTHGRHKRTKAARGGGSYGGLLEDARGQRADTWWTHDGQGLEARPKRGQPFCQRDKPAVNWGKSMNQTTPQKTSRFPSKKRDGARGNQTSSVVCFPNENRTRSPPRRSPAREARRSPAKAELR